MPRTKRTRKRKNIDGNLRGSEDIFWIKVIKGLEKFYSFARNHNWIDQSIATYDFYRGEHCV